MQTSHSPTTEFAETEAGRQRESGEGFSQVDLLTVVGILALLGLWLTPALARTRVTDQAYQCRNNLRQLMHGWRMYAEDNNGILVSPQGGGLDSFSWVQGWLTYTANTPDNTNLVYLTNSALGPYVRTPALYKCPADQSVAVEGGSLLPRVRSVSMSQAFTLPSEGHLEDGNSPPNYWRHYQKCADMVLPAPANLFVMTDESPDSINDASFSVSMNRNLFSGTIWQDGPSTLHDGGCVFAFADGHAEIHQWQDPRTLALQVTYITTFPHGMTLPNNNDIQWVRDRTTAPK